MKLRADWEKRISSNLTPQRFPPPARFRSVQTMAMTGEIGVIETEDRLGRLYDRFSARLYRFALRMARDDSEAKDLVHDAYIRAARDLRRVPEIDYEAMAWLIRVVMNLARDRHRRAMVRDAFAFATRRESHDP